MNKTFFSVPSNKRGARVAGGVCPAPAVEFTCSCGLSKIIHPRRADSLLFMKNMTIACACGGALRAARGILWHADPLRKTA